MASPSAFQDPLKDGQRSPSRVKAPSVAKWARVLNTVVEPCRSSVTRKPSGSWKTRSRTRLTWVGCSNSSWTSFMASGRGCASMDGAHFLVQVVHEDELAQAVGGGEVGLAPAHLGDLLHEGHQVAVAGQHEGVHQDPLALAVRHFLE